MAGGVKAFSVCCGACTCMNTAAVPGVNYCSHTPLPPFINMRYSPEPPGHKASSVCVCVCVLKDVCVMVVRASVCVHSSVSMFVYVWAICCLRCVCVCVCFVHMCVNCSMCVSDTHTAIELVKGSTQPLRQPPGSRIHRSQKDLKQ